MAQSLAPGNMQARGTRRDLKAAWRADGRGARARAWRGVLLLACLFWGAAATARPMASAGTPLAADAGVDTGIEAGVPLIAMPDPLSHAGLSLLDGETNEDAGITRLSARMLAYALGASRAPAPAVAALAAVTPPRPGGPSARPTAESYASSDQLSLGDLARYYLDLADTAAARGRGVPDYDFDRGLTAPISRRAGDVAAGGDAFLARAAAALIMPNFEAGGMVTFSIGGFGRFTIAMTEAGRIRLTDLTSGTSFIVAPPRSDRVRPASLGPANDIAAPLAEVAVKPFGAGASSFGNLVDRVVGFVKRPLGMAVTFLFLLLWTTLGLALRSRA